MKKDELIKIYNSSADSLNRLESVNIDLLKDKINDLRRAVQEMKDSGEELLKENSMLNIGIVGQVKAGKSSFINSLFLNGENILPKASTPMTAGLTILEFDEKDSFEIEYFTQKDWSYFEEDNKIYLEIVEKVKVEMGDAPESVINTQIREKTTDRQRSANEMVSNCSSAARAKISAQPDVFSFAGLAELKDAFEKYVGSSGEFTSVVKILKVRINDARLKDIRIIDTPGVNDPVVSREERTRAYLQKCHGVFLLSSSGDFMSSGDVNFLNNRVGDQGISAILILASKFDSALQDIGAEHLMKYGNLNSLDLPPTIDRQKANLKKRLEELASTIKVDMSKIDLDVTAGIGYSIAHKNESEWDDVEKNVVAQMSRFYPEYFTSSDDIKSTFMALANIEQIREQYLEDKFKSKKDEIMSERVNSFWSATVDNITELLVDSAKSVAMHKELLERANMEDIERQRNAESNIFLELEDNLRVKIEIFGTNLDTITKQLKKFDLTLPDFPKETAVIEALKHRLIIWDAYKNYNYNAIDKYGLKNNCQELIVKYISTLQDKWEELFDKYQSELEETLYDIIAKTQVDITSSLFGHDYYKNLIKQASSDLYNLQILKLDIPATDIDNIIEESGIEETFDRHLAREEDVISIELNKAVKTQEDSLRKSLTQELMLLKNETEKMVENEKEKAIVCVTKMQEEFASRLKKEGEKYLAELEKGIKERDTSLEVINSAAKAINELNEIYKK